MKIQTIILNNLMSTLNIKYLTENHKKQYILYNMLFLLYIICNKILPPEYLQKKWSKFVTKCFSVRLQPILNLY